MWVFLFSCLTDDESNSCITSFDDICDEGNTCSWGSDSADCNAMCAEFDLSSSSLTDDDWRNLPFVHWILETKTHIHKDNMEHQVKEQEER